MKSEFWKLLRPFILLKSCHHYPVELEEGDRSGAYVRVTPQHGPAWVGFFALGFDSDQVVSQLCSTPDPDSFCVVVGGYAYVVKAGNPAQWLRVEQRPVVDMRVLAQQGLLLFAGFTSITAVGSEGIAWTTERLTWEGLTITLIDGEKLVGHGWDALTDKEVPFDGRPENREAYGRGKAVNRLRIRQIFSAYLLAVARAWRLSRSLHAPCWADTIFIVIVP